MIYPTGFRISWRWQEGRVTGYIIGPGWRVDLEEITGVYVRYSPKAERMRPRSLGAELAATLYTECDAGLSSLLECLSCPVANRRSAAASNWSKPFQTMRIRQLGLHIPPTLVTTDPVQARQFYEECNGAVVFKSISGVRSIVRRMSVEDFPRLPLLQNGPSQFQALVPGDDIRVHTVWDRWFATRIRSAAVDYRYADDEGYFVKMEPTNLPPAVAKACVQAAKEFGLLFSGIDLRETPQGDYYCFEVNGFPAFDYYERGSGQLISAALADLLSKGCFDNAEHFNNGQK
jgi:glutathione synthase/RimK-type ligase-like ATP-grasp enzyme